MVWDVTKAVFTAKFQIREFIEQAGSSPASP